MIKRKIFDSLIFNTVTYTKSDYRFIKSNLSVRKKIHEMLFWKGVRYELQLSKIN